MKKCKLIIRDQCNCSFEGLEPAVRRECNKALKFFIHSARHTPAYRLGRWDGCVSFFAISGNTYINLLEKIIPIIIEAGYDIDLDDQRPDYNFEFPLVTEEYFVDHLDDPTWPIGHQKAGEQILLRDYQVNAIQASLDNLQSVNVLSTGAGKTIVCAALSHLCESYGRTILIVPNRDLVKQTEIDYRNVGLDVGVYYGGRKEFNKTHTICTWQSLGEIEKRSADPNAAFTIQDFIQDVVCVIVDETHTAAANILQKLLCGPLANVPIRWGLTGTMPKEEHSATAILAGIGPVVNTLAAKDLMDINVLAKCNVNIIQMMDTPIYSSFHEEYDYLSSDTNRLEWLAKSIQNISATGNTLILVSRIETGKKLLKLIPNSVFINGTTKSDERKDSYDGMSTEDNKIIIATYGVAAVGINIPRIFNLVIFEPGKSFIRVIQSIGRSIRIAKDKTSVDIYDIASTCKYSAKHVSARKKIYKAAEYPFNVKKIDYVEQLGNGHGLIIDKEK